VDGALQVRGLLNGVVTSTVGEPLELVNELRASAKVPRLKEAGYLYSRVFDTALTNKMKKVTFAKRALEQLAGEVPERAARDVRRLARFVRAATGDTT
jgi:hypothetical protein